MTTVRIGGPSSALLLAAAAPSDYLLARLQLDGLQAEHLVYQYSNGFDELATFFQSLERDWRGWVDIRTWNSIESELTIQATHDGHVHFDVLLHPTREQSWTVTARFTVEAGEQLSLIATQCRELALTAGGER